MVKSLYYNKFFNVLCVLMLIWTSGYALSTVFTNTFYIEGLFAYFLLFPIIIELRDSKIDVSMVSLISLIGMVLATYLATGLTGTTTYLSLIFKIIIAFGVTTLFTFENFIKTYIRIMKVVAIFSLVGHYLINNSNYALNLPIVTNINSVPFGIGYLFFYIPWIPERNTGIFWEPGLFATYLIIAVIIELFYIKKKNNINIILFIITILTTRSSAGYGLIFFIITLYSMKNLSYIKDFKLRRFLMLVLFIFSILIVFNYNLVIEYFSLSDNAIFSKISGNELSSQSRILAINHNLETFLRNPFFGAGFAKAFREIEYVSDTSTSTFMLSVFGILGLQYTYLWAYGILRNTKYDNFINTLILIVFLLILNKEPHHGIVFTWCVLFYFLKDKYRGQEV